MKVTRSLFRYCFVPVLTLMATVSACSQQPEQEVEVEAAIVEKGALEDFTGAHTRVVWVQDQGDGSDTFAFGNNLKVLAYDSRDGKGVRELAGEVGNYYKPIVSSDGKWVLVSDRVNHIIYKIDFASGEKEEFADGVAVDVWRDPDSGKTWVYALAGEGAENLTVSHNPLVRYRLDKPRKKELVWDKTPLSWSNLDLSLDGKFIGGLFPWPNASILDVENGKLSRTGKGCWTSLSPDNNRIMWVFDGAHRNLGFVETRNGNKWTTNINGAPGVGGYEVYHPRWSNHFNFFAMTGPYKEGEGGNKIRGGGKKVELYLGKLANDLKSVSGWYQLTHNEFADFYPDVWVKGGIKSGANFNEKEVEKVTASEFSGRWPVAEKSLFYIWEDFQAANQLSEDSLVGFGQTSVTAKGRAIFNRFKEMNLRGDGFVADFDQEKGLAVIKANKVLGVEFLFTPQAGDVEDGIIFSYGQTISMKKQGEELVLTMVGIPEPVIVSKDRFAFEQGKSVVVFLEISRDNVQLFVDGKEVLTGKLAENPLDALTVGELEFGQAGANGAGINGAISHVGVYGKALSDADILHSSQAIHGGVAKRETVAGIKLLGEVTEVSSVPAPDSLGAYSRALTVNRYLVEDVIAGEYPEKEILVAQWAVLDREVLPDAAARKIGQQESLELELFDDHPELEGERLMMDMFDPDLEVYYGIER